MKATAFVALNWDELMRLNLYSFKAFMQINKNIKDFCGLEVQCTL